MRTTFLACWLLGGLAGTSIEAASATPEALLLGGTEVSADNSYIYVGRVSSLSDAAGNGPALRLWADWSRYKYDSDGLTRKVSAPGAQLALGWQGSDAGYWWGLYAGASYRRSSITPDDLTSTVRGSRLRPILQLEGERTVQENWKLGIGGSYVTGQKAYWSRARVARRVGSSLHLGAEAITQGDPDYRARQYGAVLSGLQAGPVDIGLRLGARRVEGLESQTYFGVELGGWH